jgi:hypothetical protein
MSYWSLTFLTEANEAMESTFIGTAAQVDAYVKSVLEGGLGFTGGYSEHDANGHEDFTYDDGDVVWS